MVPFATPARHANIYLSPSRGPFNDSVVKTWHACDRDLDSVVRSKRSIWRLSTITDFFWAIVNFITVFFVTMFSMEKSDAYKRSSGSSKKWDDGPGGGGPGSGPYGRGPRGPPRGLDNVRGIDHSSLPACGSCCGG